MPNADSVLLTHQQHCSQHTDILQENGISKIDNNTRVHSPADTSDGTLLMPITL